MKIFNAFSLSSLYKEIALLSPYIEVLLRAVYWKNVLFLKKKAPKKSISNLSGNNIDLDNIIAFLKSIGIGEGNLLLVHSSYEAIEKSNLSPDEVLDQLLSLIGSTGTLAMPVIRKFKEDPKTENILNTDMENVFSTYNVQHTRVTTGFLPYYLMKRKNSVTSRFPLNPLTAVGPLAAEMMMRNLDGNLPSPHGEGSCWKFCYDHDSIILGLGVDLGHYLTMIHVAEEAFPNWVIKDWYRKRTFNIIDEEFTIEKTILERRPYFGMLHFAEQKMKRDLLTNGILKEYQVESVQISVVRSKELISFLRSKNSNGYPYYGIR